MNEAQSTPQLPAAHERVLAELQQLLGFHISLANTAIKAHFQRHSAALGLTQKQIAILWLVDGCPGIIQSDLARMLGVKRATMWAMIGTLYRRSLLVRLGAGSADTRHVALDLTAAGRAALRESRQAILRHENWVRQRFSPEEQRTVARLMTRLYQDPG